MFMATVVFPYLKVTNTFIDNKPCDIPRIIAGKYGQMVRFKAGEPTWDGKNKKNIWHTYNFVAYGDVAEKIINVMKDLRLGSEVTVTSEIQYASLPTGTTESSEERMEFKIHSIEYCKRTTFSSRKKEEKEGKELPPPPALNQQKPKKLPESFSLMENDIFMQN